MAYGRRTLAILSLALGMAATGIDARAEVGVQGISPVDSVDPVARTITLDEVVYEVPENCRIRRESGGSMRLQSLRGGHRPGELVPVTEVDYVRFEAVESASGLRMVELVVLKGPID